MLSVLILILRCGAGMMRFVTAWMLPGRSRFSVCGKDLSRNPRIVPIIGYVRPGSVYLPSRGFSRGPSSLSILGLGIQRVRAPLFRYLRNRGCRLYDVRGGPEFSYFVGVSPLCVK